MPLWISAGWKSQRPYLFLATPRPGASVELWSSGERKEDRRSAKAVPPEAPCEGRWQRVYGRSGATSFYFMESSTATVKAAVAEIRESTLDDGEVDELLSFWGLSNPEVRRFEAQRKALTAGLAWSSLLLDRREEGLKRPALVLFDDPEAPGSLDEWRSLTYLPHDLGVYVVPPNPRFP